MLWSRGRSVASTTTGSALESAAQWAASLADQAWGKRPFAFLAPASGPALRPGARSSVTIATSNARIVALPFALCKRILALELQECMVVVMAKTVSGRAKGGVARAEKLTKEERSEIARNAVQTRWARVRAIAAQKDEEHSVADAETIIPDSAMPIARWRGTLNLVGIEVPCYVLDNGLKVIGRTSAAEVLTGIKGGGGLEKYIGVKSLESFINKDIVLERFVPFRLLEVEGLERAVKGLPHDLMIEICQGFVAALQATLDPHSPYPKMTDRQMQMAMMASMFLSACAKVGLEALIDEATGYQYERAEDALQVKLRAFIADELRGWEKTFPDELWAEFGRLTGWSGPLHSRPKWWGKLVIELIYDTLDRDVAEYLKTHKPPPGIKWFQQLTDNYGARQLVSRCYEVVGMSKDCHNMRELRDKVALHYGKRPVQLTFYVTPPEDIRS